MAELWGDLLQVGLQVSGIVNGPVGLAILAIAGVLATVRFSRWLSALLVPKERQLIVALLTALGVAGLLLVAAAVMGIVHYRSEAKAPPSSGNPLQDKIVTFLAKSGRTVGFNPHGAIRMGDLGDGRGPIIMYWDAAAGPWPTPKDGFTESELRRLPKVLPVFDTQFDKEGFRRDLQALSDVVATADAIFLESQSIRAGMPNTYPDKIGIDRLVTRAEALQAARQKFWNENFNPDGTLGPFIEKHPTYEAQLQGTLPSPEPTRATWSDYEAALNNLTRSLVLMQRATILGDRALVDSAFNNLPPYIFAFDRAMQGISDWSAQSKARIEMMRRPM